MLLRPRYTFQRAMQAKSSFISFSLVDRGKHEGYGWSYLNCQTLGCLHFDPTPFFVAFLYCSALTI